MKMFLSGIFAMLAFSQFAAAANFSYVNLFEVSVEDNVIQYKARVDTDSCSFDQKQPTEAFMVTKGAEHPANFLEKPYVAVDYLVKEATKVVAEVKFLERNNIHWPLALLVGRDNQGRCQSVAVGTAIGEVIKNVAITQTDNNDVPTEMVVTGLVNGQTVQKDVSLKDVSL